MTAPEFVDVFGGIYEHSPWVAENTWKHFDGNLPNDLETLRQVMKTMVDEAPEAIRLALMRSHPDLAGKAALAGELTHASTSEQAGAGLDVCSAEELAEFNHLNTNYKERFGFPFIIAVGGLNRWEILQAFRIRVANTVEVEFDTGMVEIHKIAKLRFHQWSLTTGEDL